MEQRNQQGKCPIYGEMEELGYSPEEIKDHFQRINSACRQRTKNHMDAMGYATLVNQRAKRVEKYIFSGIAGIVGGTVIGGQKGFLEAVVGGILGGVTAVGTCMLALRYKEFKK